MIPLSKIKLQPPDFKWATHSLFVRVINSGRDDKGRALLKFLEHLGCGMGYAACPQGKDDIAVRSLRDNPIHCFFKR
jgi:hypothetical protein